MKGTGYSSRPFVSVLLLVACLIAQAAVLGQAAHAQVHDWYDTGLTLAQPLDAAVCFDSTRQDVFLQATSDGTTAYNWLDGTHRLISSQRMVQCGLNGWVYGFDSATGFASRWSIDHPQPQRIEHVPTHLAEDGSSQVYSIGYSGHDVNHLLFASDDDGATWQERGSQFVPRIKSLAVSPVNARAIYIVVDEQDPTTHVTSFFDVYFSADAGRSWELRGAHVYTGNPVGYPAPTVTVQPLMGSRSVNDVMLMTDRNIGGSGDTQQILLSGNQGRTFQQAAVSKLGLSDQLISTPRGLLRLSFEQLSGQILLARSMDGGTTWQPISAPFITSGIGANLSIRTAPNLPSTVFITINNTLWYSFDSGDQWRSVVNTDGNAPAQVTPYLPLMVVGAVNNQFVMLTLPEASSQTTDSVQPSEVAGQLYFQATHHTLSPLFVPTWQTRGGLPMFGYPKTEPFREYNPADGRVYLVQYVERNRFEYHPELHGTASEVLLGLLGDQVTAVRRAQGEAVFQPITDPQQPGERYFPATGHTIRNSFRRYWEANGGLASFGYPISNEFVERNPDDGQNYTVQYFERARFEYHPEYRGTASEVLLGLLGNAVLSNK